MAAATGPCNETVSNVTVTKFLLVNPANDSLSTPESSNLSSSAFPEALDISGFHLNLPYTICEVVVAVAAVIGNALVLAAFVRDNRLKRRTNYYIVSLAIADLLFGLIGIPAALLASVGLPRGFHACLFSICFLITLCMASIFCLLAVSVDRYWAILHPMSYTRDVGGKTAFVVICICWVAATIVGFIPMMGWNGGYDLHCFFTKVMDYHYLVFLYFATIITPALLMAFFYAAIYRVVLQQLRKRIAMDSALKGSRCCGRRVGIRAMLGAAQQCEINVTQNLAVIFFFFILCWMPLFTMNSIKAFCPDCYFPEYMVLFLVILSHVNAAVNPIIYAYRMRDFRIALRAILCGENNRQTIDFNDDGPSFPADGIRRTVSLDLIRSQESPTKSSTLSLNAVGTNSEAPSRQSLACPQYTTYSPTQKRLTTIPLKVISEC